MNRKIKLFVSDIDGTLTNGTVFYSEKGEELKQFSHRDGRGFHLLKHNSKVKTMLITNESGGINAARAAKFQRLGTLDYFFENVSGIEKVDRVKNICKELNIELSEVAFIGDDTNDLELLESVGIAACPQDANYKIVELNNIMPMSEKSGHGAVREFIDYLFDCDLLFMGE